MTQHTLPKSSVSNLRLSPDEVRRKYAPIPDVDWTPEREAAFFAALAKRGLPTQPVKRLRLVSEYATETLGAQRMSCSYLDALCAVLGAFAEADRCGLEVRLSQRMAQYGTPQTLRTIQAQMEKAGVLTKEVRSQGHGFVGTVYVYAPPKSPWPPPEDLEAARERRAVPYPIESLVDIGIDDAPY